MLEDSILHRHFNHIIGCRQRWHASNNINKNDNTSIVSRLENICFVECMLNNINKNDSKNSITSCLKNICFGNTFIYAISALLINPAKWSQRR